MQWHLYNTLTSERTFNFKCYLFVNDCFKLHKSKTKFYNNPKKENQPIFLMTDQDQKRYFEELVFEW